MRRGNTDSITRSIADGRYRQPCACASRRALAKIDAKRLRERADAARRDAVSAEMDEEHVEAAEFRREAAELEARARAVLRAAPKKKGADPACRLCSGKGEVIGNGTYGGPAKRQRIVMAVM